MDVCVIFICINCGRSEGGLMWLCVCLLSPLPNSPIYLYHPSISESNYSICLCVSQATLWLNSINTPKLIQWPLCGECDDAAYYRMNQCTYKLTHSHTYMCVIGMGTRCVCLHRREWERRITHSHSHSIRAKMARLWLYS